MLNHGVARQFRGVYMLNHGVGRQFRGVCIF